MSRRKSKADIPVMVECSECSGHGTVQASCVECDVGLTTNNVEPGTDDLCAACAGEDGAVHPHGGYAHMGCKCVGCLDDEGGLTYEKEHGRALREANE